MLNPKSKIQNPKSNALISFDYAIVHLIVLQFNWKLIQEVFMEELLIVGGIGVVALLALGSVVSLASPQTSQVISDTGRNAAKSGIKLGMEACEKVQATFAEASQSWQD
jgi:hypothetical protein